MQDLRPGRGCWSSPPPYWTGSPDRFFGFQFSNGKVLSGEFTEDGLDDQQAQKGLWLELQTDDVEGLQQRVQDFGLKRIVHPYTSFFYIQAPGGQVFRIVSSKDAHARRPQERPENNVTGTQET